VGGGQLALEVGGHGERGAPPFVDAGSIVLSWVDRLEWSPTVSVAHATG
jgi:hypothetical protein